MTTIHYTDEIAFGKDALVFLGRTTGAHGLKGQVSFDLVAKEESILKKGMSVHLLPKESGKISWRVLKNFFCEETGTYKLQVNFLQHTPKKTILALENINDRTMLDNLGPFAIYLPRSLFPKCQEDEFYWADMKGLTVMCQSEGTVVGKVVDVYDNGVQTVLSLQLDFDDDNILDLPFIDDFFPKIDLPQKMIWVNLPEVW